MKKNTYKGAKISFLHPYCIKKSQMNKELPEKLASFLLSTKCSILPCSLEEKMIHFQVSYQLLITHFLTDRMCKIIEQNVEQLTNFQRILHIPLKVRNLSVLQPGIIGGCIRINANRIFWHKHVDDDIPSRQLFSNFKEYVEIYNISDNETKFQDCIIPVIYEIADTFESISKKIIYNRQGDRRRNKILQS